MNRIDTTFSTLAAQGRKALVGFLTAGDPDHDTSLAILRQACAAGLDVVELGVPFSDPTADGPVIQRASQRALKTGTSLSRTITLAAELRRAEATPIVLFSYYNPIFKFGLARAAAAAVAAGVDGLLVVDLPPEEDAELCIPALAAGVNFIRLATPTTDDKRLPKVLQNTSGFVYYVSITGITGSAAATAELVGPEVARIKAATDLPVCVGFGIRTAEAAADIAAVADGAVVGSAIVERIGRGDAPEAVLTFVRELAAGAHR